MITIPLSRNIDVKFLLKSIQELISKYDKNNEDIEKYVLLIDVKQTVETNVISKN